MNKFIARLKDERILLLLAYSIGMVNFFVIKYVNAVLFTKQNEAILRWLPVMRVFATVAAILTFLALFLFILRKAPRYKWCGYALLITSVISGIFTATNVNWFASASMGLNNLSLQFVFYVTLNLAHVILNLLIAYLIVTYQFFNEKSYNIVVAIKLINTSLLLGFPLIKLLPFARISPGIYTTLMNLDPILKSAIIVVLLLSLFNDKTKKPSA